MSDFYTLLTAVGAAKFTNAVALGTAVNFTSFAVGDGNDVADPSGFISYSPDGNETALVNEQYRGNVNSVVVDPQNADQLIIQCVVPTSEGGWWITELGLFDADGDMLAIGKIAPTQKATVASGTAQDFNFKIYLKTTGSEQAVLKVDPAMVLASQQFVLDALENAGGSDIGDINGLQAALDAKSAAGHGHVIGDTAGLQAALDAKSGTDHTHIIADVTGLQTALDSKSNTDHTHTNPVFHIRHQEANGVSGGTANTGNNIRNMNTVVENDISGASLDAPNRRFTLPAGTFKFTGSAASYLCDQNKLTLYNVTDAVAAVIGPNAWSYDTPGTSTAHLIGRLTLADSKIFELHHFCANGQGTNGFGASVTGDGNAEIYAELFIEKVG